LAASISILQQEDQIVQLLHKGDTRGIDLIYEKYADALYGVIQKIINNEHDAEDVLQTSLVKIWKNGATYDSNKGRLFTWMLNICRNTALDKIKSKGSRNEKSNRDIDIATNYIDSKQNENLNIETLDIKKQVNQLPADQKTLIDLMYFKGHTQAEIAEIVDIPLGTVKTKLRSAILSLRTIFNAAS
jgi:RNA polymerase sigma-70 factor, ECF subfamily